MGKNFKELFESSLKSNDTVEWIDKRLLRPIGLLLAFGYNKINVTPNGVTIISIVIGVIAGIMFYFPDVKHNVIGAVLLEIATIHDCADGQLARLTNRTSRLGRLLDGFAGDMWFFTIYFCLCCRLTYQPIPFADGVNWGVWVWLLSAFGGLVCHSRQCALGDYYRNIHLFFLQAKNGFDLDTSKELKEALHRCTMKSGIIEILSCFFYSRYCAGQERQTPEFQKLIAHIRRADGSYREISASMRNEFLDGSRPLLKYTNLLTFNLRSLILYVSCIVGMPWIFLLSDVTLFAAMHLYMRYRHEALCRRLRLEYYSEDTSEVA
jgi:phosphatidylglycerophosphate synthase